ncbi:MAG: DUF4252 domain-containing protein [Rhodothermaceae bacterium]
MKNLIKLFLMLIIAAPTLIFAQKKDYSNEPGYVDFTKFENFIQSDETTEVIVENKLLRMVGRIVKNKDPELKDLLDNLKLVKAISFETVDKSFSDLYGNVQKIADKLDGMGWDRIVKSKSKERITFVYIKTKGDEDVLGLAVMNVEKDGESSFVNVVGKINLDAIGRLGDKFNIPALDNVKH